MSVENTTFKEVDKEVDIDNIPTANIVVAGITGTGKSTLVNAIFGEDLAETGSGHPVTDKIKEYNNPSIPIRIWDTVGLELDAEKTRESIKAIRDTIFRKSESDDQFDKIHAIWYCINSGSNRYQGAELDFIKNLHSIGVPFMIILTQCIGDDDEINAFEDRIKEINKSMGMGDIEIVQVLATDKKTKKYTIEAFGLDTLVDVTIKKMPQFVKSGFVAAQMISKIQKRIMSEKIIASYIVAAQKGIWDKVPLINIFTTDIKIGKMFRKIGQMYNVILSDDEVNSVMKQLGGKIGNLDLDNGWNGLINPFNGKFNKKIEILFSQHKINGSIINADKLDKKEKVARLILFYGYTFIDAIEELWEQYVKDKSKELESIAETLTKIIKKRLKENSGRRR